MEQVIDFLQDNPAYLAGALALLAVVIALLLRKLVKYAVLGLLLLGLYSWYINDQANNVGIGQHLQGGMEDIRDAGKKLLD